MNLVDVLLAKQLGGGGGGGGITPEQLAIYVKNNTIKKVIDTPNADDYAVGDLIFDLSDAQIKICVSGQGGKSWENVTQSWLNTFRQEVLDQLYQEKITAGAGLVFDGNTLKHSNHVTPKPQRFIRATAYDAEGHAINFGADYLVSRTDNNDDVLSDSYLSSTLWVHKHYSPIEASSFINKDSILVDDCVFNMMNIGDSTLTRRSQKRYIGLANFTNPITNSPLYGGIDVTEYWYTYLQEGTGTCKIEQVFKNSYNGNNSITFKRFGTLAFDLAGEFGTAIYTNRASIVWGNWFPVEYPTIPITKESIVDEGSISFRVKSGMGVVDFSALVVDEFANPSAVLGTLPAGIQAVLSDTKHYIGNNNGDMHGLNVTSNGNLQLWKKTGDVFPLSLSGTIMFPIGY